MTVSYEGFTCYYCHRYPFTLLLVFFIFVFMSEKNDLGLRKNVYSDRLFSRRQNRTGQPVPGELVGKKL